PLMAAGIEEPRALAGLGIDAGEVRAFMVVIGEACEREIAGDAPTAMLFGGDMIDFKLGFVVDLRHPAVFTTFVSAFPDQLDKSEVHGGSSARAGTLEHLPGFRLESRENRAGALEVIHRRILFWRQSSGAGLGREFMHPSHVVLAEGKPQNGTRHPRRQFLIG